MGKNQNIFSLYPGARDAFPGLSRSPNVLFLVLLVALFLTDAVAFLSAPDAVNTPVAWTMLGALVVFSAELALNCACRDGYPWSFYFFMDALGTFRSSRTCRF